MKVIVAVKKLPWGPIVGVQGVYETMEKAQTAPKILRGEEYI